MSDFDKKIGVKPASGFQSDNHSSSIPVRADGKPVEISLDQISFYQGPEEVQANTSVQNFSIQNNSAFQRRLKVEIELAKYQKVHQLLKQLDQPQGDADLAEIQKTRELIGKQLNPMELERVLFHYLHDLLAPEGLPVNEQYYAEAVNTLFANFRGKLSKPIITQEKIKQIFSRQTNQGIIETKDLYHELSLLMGEEIQSTGQVVSLGVELLPKIKEWMQTTEKLGFRNSIRFERAQFQEVHKALKKAETGAVHCENLLKTAATIEQLLDSGKFKEAKKLFLTEYLNSRRHVLEIHAEVEQVKKFKHYTVGVAIVVAAGFVAYFTAGAAVPVITRGVASPFLKFGTHVAISGSTFVASEKILNKFLMGEELFDSTKSGWENARDFTFKSIFMGLLGPFLGRVVQFSRMHSLLPSLVRQGRLEKLPEQIIKDYKIESLFKNGVLDLTTVEARGALAKIMEMEIHGMTNISKALFHGREFVEEVGAFVGWELLESQVTLLAEGKKPSLKNLEVIDKILSGEAMVDRVLFLGALKSGNRIAKPLTEPASQWLQGKVIEWEQKWEIKRQIQEYFSHINPTSQAPTLLGRLSFLGVSLAAFFSSGAASKNADPIAGLATLAGLALVGTIWGNGPAEKRSPFEIGYHKSLPGLATDLLDSFKTAFKEAEKLKNENNPPLAVALRAFEGINVFETTIKIRELLDKVHRLGQLSYEGKIQPSEFDDAIKILKKEAPLLFYLANAITNDPSIMAIAKKPELANAILKLEIHLKLLKELDPNDVSQLEALLFVIKNPLLRLQHLPSVKKYIHETIGEKIKLFLLNEEADFEFKPVEALIERLGSEYSFIKEIAKLSFDEIIENIQLGADDLTTESYFGSGGGIIKSFLLATGAGLEAYKIGIAEAAQQGVSSLAEYPGISLLLMSAGLFLGMAAGKKKPQQDSEVKKTRYEAKLVKEALAEAYREQIRPFKLKEINRLFSVALSKDQRSIRKAIEQLGDFVPEFPEVLDKLFKIAISNNRTAVGIGVEQLARYVPTYPGVFEKIIKVCQQKAFVIPILTTLFHQKGYQPAYDAIVKFGFKTTYKVPITLLIEFATSSGDPHLAKESLDALVDITAHHLKRKQSINKDHAVRILEDIYNWAANHEDDSGRRFYGALKKLALDHPKAAKLVDELEKGENIVEFEPDFSNFEGAADSKNKKGGNGGVLMKSPSTDIVDDFDRPEVAEFLVETERDGVGIASFPWKVDLSLPPEQNNGHYGELEGIGQAVLLPYHPAWEGKGLVLVKVVERYLNGDLILQTTNNKILKFIGDDLAPPFVEDSWAYLAFPEENRIPFSKSNWIKTGGFVSSLLLGIDQFFSSTPAFGGVKSALESLPADTMGILSLLGLTVAAAVVSTKTKATIAVTEPQKAKATVLSFPLKQSNYEVNKHDNQDPLAKKIGKMSWFRDVDNKKLLRSKGFGFLIFKNAPNYSIRGEGFEYCSRLMIFDPTTKIAVDSHLPVADSDLPSFRDDLARLKSHLESLGVNLAKAKTHLIYGNGDDDRPDRYPGLKVAEELEKQGFKLTSIQPARGGDVPFDFNIKTGKITKVE